MGQMMTGKVAPSAVVSSRVVEPYPALVKLYQKSKKMPSIDDQIAAVGPMAYQAALMAAKRVKSLPANWVSHLDKAYALYEAGSLAEKLGRKMQNGEDVDLTPLTSLLNRASKGETRLVKASSIKDEGEDFILTGYEPYDTNFGGLPDSSMTIVAAPPGVGKTWHLLQLMAAFLKKYPKKIAVLFPLEMSNRQTMRRLKRDLRLPKSILDRLYICDDVLDTMDLVSVASRASAYGDVGIIGVDFAELVLGGDASANESEMAFVAKTLERTAIRMGIPIILVSQLSRKYDGAFYSLTMLKYSGSLESAAAMVIFLHNPDQVLLAQNNQANMLPLEDGYGFVIQAKSRFGFKQGSTGAAKVKWNGIGWGDKSKGWTRLRL